MQFHAVRIIVDQPFAFLPAGSDGLTAQDMQKSRESCHDAAWHITKLLQASRRHFSLRRVNIQAVHLIFTAMLVHVHSAFLSPDYQIRDTARRQLEICSQALGEIGQAYKNALRALEIITSIKSDLLRRERNALTNGAMMIGQPASMNSMIALGQIPSTMFLGDTRASQSWQTNYSNDGLLNGFDLVSGIDLEQCASLTGQMPLSDQPSWTPFTETFAPSNPEEGYS